MIIGIPGYEIDGMFGVNSNYLSFIETIGTPEIISPRDDLPKHIQGVVLPGGSDVLPSRYGKPGFFTGRASPHLEYFDAKILPVIIGRVPIFGICRGLQTINVLLGGTLDQHLRFHPYSSYEDELVHGVKAPGGSDNKPAMNVNSSHHQAIGYLGKGVDVELYSTDFYHVKEAISGKHFFAVQWHPERILDDYSLNHFKKVMNGEI